MVEWVPSPSYSDLNLTEWLVAISPHFSSQPQGASSWLRLWLPSAPTLVLSLKMHHPNWVSGCHQPSLQFSASRCIILADSLVAIGPPLQFSASRCIILNESLVAISPYFSSQLQDTSSRVSVCHQPPLQFAASKSIILTESFLVVSLAT